MYMHLGTTLTGHLDLHAGLNQLTWQYSAALYVIAITQEACDLPTHVTRSCMHLYVHASGKGTCC